jgi:hypothetical protein
MSKILTLCMICKFHIVVLVMELGQKYTFIHFLEGGTLIPIST